MIHPHRLLAIVAVAALALAGCTPELEPPVSPLPMTTQPVLQPQSSPRSEPMGRLLRQVVDRGGTAYFLYLPEGYKADRQWPLIVLGDSIQARSGRPPGEISRLWQIRADLNGWMVLGVPLNLPGRSPTALAENEPAVMAAVDDVLGRWSVDRSRMFVTAATASARPMAEDLARRQEKRLSLLPEMER